MPVLTFHDVHLAWPDGDTVFTGLDLQVPHGRSGLVGANGTGKTTLLRLAAGDLTPTSGVVSVPERVAWLRQDLVLRAEQPVDEHLGIAGVRAAIRALEEGSDDPSLLEVVGDRWDVEERAEAELHRLGLPGGVLDRRLGELSGGECTRLALAALLLDRPDLLLLDEPTNNLDRAGREHLYETIAGYRGDLVVVSHDRELLEHVDRVGELRVVPGRAAERTLSWYGGGWSAYQDQVRVEQDAAEQAVTAARNDVRRQRRELVDLQVVLARRKRYGQKQADNLREPRIAMHQRRNQAQVSAAKLRGTQQARADDARARLDEAELRLRDDDEITVDLPQTAVPAGRQVLVLRELVLRTGLQVDLEVRGPERVALAGANGSGKTTLLHTVCGLLAADSGTVDLRVPSRLLPQRLDVLDTGRSVAQNAAGFAPSADVTDLRTRLARFGFRGTAADRSVAALSGGELFRATLACLLLAEPAPQLLVLDEPTNNLDLASTRQLVSALAGFRGALLVASHDRAFCDDIGVDRVIDLDEILRGAGAPTGDEV